MHGPGSAATMLFFAGIESFFDALKIITVENEINTLAQVLEILAFRLRPAGWVTTGRPQAILLSSLVTFCMEELFRPVALFENYERSPAKEI